VTGNPSDLADVDYLCLAVPDGAAVSALLLEQRLLGALRAQTTVLVHSTVQPETARSLAAACARRGVAFVDAPVSGGAARARSGDLTVTVGATDADLRRARPVLEAEASDIVHVGDPGAGAAVKLANQLMLFASLAGAYEALRLAGAYGVSEEVALRAVSTGTGASWVSQNWGFYDQLSTDYDEAGVPAERRPWSKDLRDVVAAAREAEVPAPLADLLTGVLPPDVASHAARQHTDAQKVG
jgi:3-hydroxyisobutyrate dehydrogenase